MVLQSIATRMSRAAQFNGARESNCCIVGPLMLKHLVALAFISCAALSGVTGQAQAPPKFAGTWRPLHLAVTDNSQNITIRQDADTIAITVGNPQTTTVYSLAGERRNGDRVSKTSWDGEKLVIETVGPDRRTTKLVLRMNSRDTLLAIWREDEAVDAEPMVYQRLMQPGLTY